MRAIFGLMFTFAALSSPCLGQVSLAKKTARPEVERLIGLAGSTPAEFQAHALLRLSEEFPAADRKTLIGSIERAFDLALRVPEEIALQQVFGGTNSVSGALRRVFPAGLDSVSLRVRAARAMARLDRERSLQMLDEVRLPPLPPRGCGDHLTYDPARFYDALATLATEAFSPEERAAERHVEFLGARLSALQHSTELLPALSLLVRIDVTATQRERLIRIFAERMEQLPSDWRSLSGRSPILVRRISEFAAPLQPEIRTRVIAAFRRLVANHLAADRCPDVTPGKPGQESPDFNGEGRRLADFFNEVLLPKAASGSVEPLTAKLQTGKLLPGGPGDEFFDQGQARELYNLAVVILLQGDAETKATSEWRKRAERLFDAVVAWSGKEEPDPVRFFLAKAHLLRLFVTAPIQARPFEGKTQADLDAYLKDQSRRPEFGDREKAQGLLIEFLESAPADAAFQKRHLLWYAPVHVLIETEWRSFRGDLPPLIALLKRSRNPILALEGYFLEARYRKNLP